MISFRTDKQHKNTDKLTRSNRWKVLITINVCLAIMCAAVFGISAFTVRANAAYYSEEKSLSTDWYEVADDGRTLNIHLDNEMNGYTWRYGISNDKIRELTFFEMTDDLQTWDQKYDWNAHFTSESDISGDVVLTLQYVLNGETNSIDTRTIPVHIDNGIISLQ